MDDLVKSLIANYKPSQEVVNAVEQTDIVLLCGITGAGKDTIKHELLNDKRFSRIITSTTRAPRENEGVMEQDGREYYFYTLDQAIDNIKNQRYFEVAIVHEQINGVTADEIERLSKAGLTGVGDVDYQGIDYFKKYTPSTLAIFLLPPRFEVWLERLRKRYDTDAEFEAALPVRIESAVHEMRWALEAPDLRMVANDTLAQTVDAVKGVIHDQAEPDGGREIAEELLARFQEMQTSTRID